MNFSATIHHIDVENFIFSETWWENFCLSYFSLNILNSRMPFLGSTWPLLLIWKPAHHFFRRSFTLLSADRSVKFEGLKGFREEREKTWFSFSQKKCWKCWNQFWAAGNSREIQAGFFLCIFFFLERYIPRSPGSVFRRRNNRCGPLFWRIYFEILFINWIFLLPRVDVTTV